jgi:syntaxin 16
MSAGAYEDDGDAVIEMDLLPPRWLDIQDEVTELLADIATQTRKLEQLHQKHVLPGFDDEAIKRKEEKEIERITQHITRQFQNCQKAIKRIDSMVRDSKETGGISGGEETMAQNLKISLAGRVGDASTLFRKKQSNYLRSMSSSFYAISDGRLTNDATELKTLGGLSTPLDRASTPVVQNPYTDPSLMDSETDRSFSQSTLLQAKQQRLLSNSHDTVIAQREREIEDIAQSIIDLANIFQEIQTMVIDQGTLLDRIDYNVEKMATEVKAADKELTVATGYQKRSMKRKVILLLIIIIAGMFILLGLKISSKKSKGGDVQPPPPSGNDLAPDLPLPPQRRSTVSRDTAAADSLHDRNWRRRRRREPWDSLENIYSDFL